MAESLTYETVGSCTNSHYGLIDRAGKHLYKASLFVDHFWQASPTLLAVKKDGKVTFRKSTGKLAFKGNFTDALSFSEGLCAVRVGDLWGFINEQGSFVISPQYEEALQFQNRLAPAKLDKWGYIDKSGKFVIPPTFSHVLEFSEDMAAVESSGKVGFIDSTGKLVVEPTYDYATSFGEGFALVAKIEGSEERHHIQYIDKNGEVKIDVTELQLKCDPSGRDVRTGSAPASGREMLSTRRSHNEWVHFFSPTGRRPEQFSDGLAVIKCGGRYGYIDKSGKIAIPPNFDEAYAFEEGVAMVRSRKTASFLHKKDCPFRLSEPAGFINKDGKFLIDPKFEDAYSFSEGLAAVEQNGKFGFVDHSGHFLIKPRFDIAKPFFGGGAMVGLPVELWI